MRYSNCVQCGGIIQEDDTNPNVHYSNPSTICFMCERKNNAPDGTWLQHKDGTYYQKQSNNAIIGYEVVKGNILNMYGGMIAVPIHLVGKKVKYTLEVIE